MLTKHLGGMVAIPQFFLWRLQWNAAANKYKKSPCALDGAVYAIDASDRANWCDYATAQTALGRLTASPRADGLAYALGFWLTADCPYWFLDLDKALGADGQWLPFASQLVACYPGAFVEVFSSGAGLHIIVTGTAPAPAHRNKTTQDVATNLAPMDIEYYTLGRGIPYEMYTQPTGCAAPVFIAG